MDSSQEKKMKAVILYDSRTKSGSTEAIIDAMGQKLAERGVYVEKAKCKALADYSFVCDFDLVILGAPVYYFLVSSQSRALSAKWTDESKEWLQTIPSFLQSKFRTMAEEYAENMGYKEITLEMLELARDEMGGT